MIATRKFDVHELCISADLDFIDAHTSLTPDAKNLHVRIRAINADRVSLSGHESMEPLPACDHNSIDIASTRAPRAEIA